MIKNYTNWLIESSSALSTVEDMKSNREQVISSIAGTVDGQIYSEVTDSESDDKLLKDYEKGFESISDLLKISETEILHLSDQKDAQWGNYDFLKEFGLHEAPGAVKNVWESEFDKDDQDYSWMIQQNVNGLDMIIWKGLDWNEWHYYFGIADFLHWLEKTDPSKISRAFQYGDFMKIMNNSKKISPEFLHKYRGTISGKKFGV